jgi:hypothetical protein
MKEILLLLVGIIVLNSCKDQSQMGYEDEFISNKIGWIEETSKSHDLFISNGKYTIENKDSTTALSSTHYLDKSWHYNLSSPYTISSSITISGESYDSLSCGLILECNSYLYEFAFYQSGKIYVSEYNYQNEETLYMNNVDSLYPTKKFDFSLNVSDWEFDLKVNEKNIAIGDFHCKSWNRIVPFTGKLTKSEIEYFKLKKN